MVKICGTHLDDSGALVPDIPFSEIPIRSYCFPDQNGNLCYWTEYDNDGGE